MGRSNALGFTFKGTTSASMGLRVTKLPDIQIAEERGRTVEIPGRDGVLWLPDNSFKPISLKVEFEISRASSESAYMTRLNEVTAWLTGSGNLILSTMPDYYWKARITKGFDLRNGVYISGRFRVAIEFACQPFRYLVNEPTVTVEQPGLFDGSGTWTARPVITVNGSGSMNLIVNNRTILIDDMVDHITIDCDAMMAYKDGVNVSPQITIMPDADDDDEWPMLYPGEGENRVNWSSVPGESGSISSVVIQPNWRWR